MLRSVPVGAVPLFVGRKPFPCNWIGWARVRNRKLGMENVDSFACHLSLGHNMTPLKFIKKDEGYSQTCVGRLNLRNWAVLLV